MQLINPTLSCLPNDPLTFPSQAAKSVDQTISAKAVSGIEKGE